MSAASLLEGLDASTLATLERNDIRTVEDLQALSEGDVQELGLSIGHRNQLQKRIAAARKPEPTERTPLAGASIIADGSKKEPTERTPLAGASIIGDREYVGDGSKTAGGGVCNGVCICVSICIVVGLGVGAAFMFSVPNERDTSFDCTTSLCNTCQSHCPYNAGSPNFKPTLDCKRECVNNPVEWPMDDDDDGRMMLAFDANGTVPAT